MKKAHVAVLYAPGTNCHKETIKALAELGIESSLVFVDNAGNLSRSLRNFTGLILPGGFSFGDHFGAGRVLALLIKRRLKDVLLEFAARNKQILGICNGFQILTESGLLPGALLQNNSAHFDSPSSWVKIRAAQWDFWRTNHLGRKSLLLPVAHGEGRFVWEGNELVFPAFHYVDNSGNPTMSYPANPAGSQSYIAGITDKSGYIMGMMPHPERASLPFHKSRDGLEILKIFTNS